MRSTAKTEAHLILLIETAKNTVHGPIDDDIIWFCEKLSQRLKIEKARQTLNQVRSTYEKEAPALHQSLPPMGAEVSHPPANVS